VAVEEVVAEDKGGGFVADELGADVEGLGEALRARLFGVLERRPELGAVAEEAAERAAGPCGVEMIRISRIPASISTESG
jgi:hypothetical protein